MRILPPKTLSTPTACVHLLPRKCAQLHGWQHIVETSRRRTDTACRIEIYLFLTGLDIAI